MISIQIFQAGLRKSKSLQYGVFITLLALQPYAHLQPTAASSFGGLSRVSWWSFHLAAIYLWDKNITGWDTAGLQHLAGVQQTR